MDESEVQQDIVNDGDWVERFIQAVQCRPPIYNTKLPEHSDRNLVLRLWSEIYEAMVPTWQELTSSEKSLKGKELQNRWRNLKTCFRRELHKQKHGKSGQAATKRRKYIFFDQLLFLLPTIEDRPTVSECSPTNTIYTTVRKPSTPKRKPIQKSATNRKRLQLFQEKHEDFNKTCTEVVKRKHDVTDEFDAVGINVSAKLRKMDSMQQVLAESLINKILAKGFFKELTRSTDITDTSSINNSLS